MTRDWVPLAVAGAAVFAALAFLPASSDLRVAPFDRYGKAVIDGRLPYRDFSLEYPPGALVPIVIPALAPGLSYEHAFRAFEAVVGCALAAGVAFLLRDAAPRPLALRVGAVAAVPALLGPVVYFRFDLWPALLIVLSMVTLARARERAAGALLGVAAAAKLYPAALVLPLALSAARRSHDRARAVLASASMAFAVCLAPFALAAPGGLASSLREQIGRGLQIESLGALPFVLAHVLGGRSLSVRFAHGAFEVHGQGVGLAQDLLGAVGFVALLVLLTFIWHRRARIDVPLAYSSIVGVILVFSKVLSPQYLVWIVPLAALVRGRAGMVATALLAVALVLTQVLYPSHYEALVALHSTEVALLAVRDVLLVAATAVCVGALVVRTREPVL